METNRHRKTIPDAEERSDLAAAAFRRVLDQIAQTESATKKEALELLVKFASYWVEFNLNQEDIVSHKKADNPDYFGVHSPIMRGTYEMALAQARTGDYRKLKEVLGKEDINSWQSVTGFPENFTKLLKLMPDEGDPIVYPKPAWIDEFEYQQTQNP